MSRKSSCPGNDVIENSLARFNLLDYVSCLHLLDTEGTENQVALSYAF